MDPFQQSTDCAMRFQGMTKMSTAFDEIPIAPSFLDASHHTRLFKVREDAVDGPLGHPNHGGEVAHAQLGLCGQADENMRMVTQIGESP